MATKFANTKHYKVSRMLEESIRFLPPGEMLPTIERLKIKYKCSQVTITQALERLRNYGVVERPSGKKRLVVAKLGNRPSFRVTLVRPLWPSPDYDSITNAIYELGHDEHFGFNIYLYGDPQQLNIDHALRDSDAGLVLGDRNMTREQIDAFNGCRKPIVFLRDKPDAVKSGYVWVDDLCVGETAANHLLDLGHKKIAVMLSEPENVSSSLRLQGWRKALQQKGVREFGSLIIDCSVSPGKDAITGSYKRFASWMDTNERTFTAIFCVAWTGALAALKGLRERGIRVPEDVSMVTYASESSICDFTAPPLTTVQIDTKAYAREAIRLIRESFAVKRSHLIEKIDLKPYLEERESVRRISK
jgi:DNA-binding LacI/PurR family transcriptional regulator